MPSPLTTLALTLEPDPARTVIRPFDVSYPQPFADAREARRVVVARRLLDRPDAELDHLADLLLGPMCDRHRNATAVFRRRYDELDQGVRALPATDRQRILLGAIFSQEYAFESAALFNPSILPAPSNPTDDDGGTRFLLSLRGIGEGHISSITFRIGHWSRDGQVRVEPPSEQGVPPRITRNLEDGGAELLCEDAADVSETVIFPVLPSQRQGIEDLRMVLFTDDDGTRSVMGTYTAFDGRAGTSEMLHGIDLRTLIMHTLSGAMADYKGMALFPRRIGGRYAMLGRQDGESIWFLQSDDLYRWEAGAPILHPAYPWEFVQLGNCGSPIEIDEGWLVFTHGVGFVRSYCIGACLLDRDDPTKVLARTPEPLLFASETQRGGYVPNVVYSCGALVRGREILLPYAVGDRYTTFATGTVDGVLAAMVPAA